MKYTTFNGQYIGDSAVAFFNRLSVFESGENEEKGYLLADQKKYIGRYQLGTDALAHIKWVKSDSGWDNAVFIGEAATKWKIRNKRDFLNNPKAQDDAMMKAIAARWKYFKYTGQDKKICSKITVPSDAPYRKPNKENASLEKVRSLLNKKRLQGYTAEDMRGKTFTLTSSGLLAASHLCGQGAMSNALSNNFKGKYGIPVDGNSMPSLFYHQNLTGYDLSVITGFKDSCLSNKVVLKNDTQTDNRKILETVKKTQASSPAGNTGTKAKPSENGTFGKKAVSVSGSEAGKPEKAAASGNGINKDGVYIFNGQKFEEVWDTEEYRKDREEFQNRKAPEIVFVDEMETVTERLHLKFLNPEIYNRDYIKYLETKTGKKVLEENRDDIGLILKRYDEATKDERGIGNVVRQVNFDLLRGRGELSEKIRIQDIVYYIYSTPIENKGKIESIEHVLAEFGAMYVIYPDKKPVEGKQNSKEYSSGIRNIVSKIPDEKKETTEKKIQKNVLPEKYGKYMEGYKDIDEMIIKVEKKDTAQLEKTRCQNLIKELANNDKEFDESYSLDENGVRKYPLARRLVDNIIIEFLKVQTGFKTESEKKYFDDHKYKDSNVLRNYLLWYIQRQRGIGIPSENDNGLFGRLERIGKELRITTVLQDWISSKSAIKVRNIRQISKLTDEAYDDYSSGKDYQKDKAIMRSLFEDGKTLRDYCANIDSMEIYSFYKSFYELQNIVNPKDELFVNDNCILKCTFGEDISRLIISEDSVRLRGGRQANISDKNILPFKKCRAAGTCKPQLLGMWEKTTDVKVRNQPALLDVATIKCNYGGIISIDDAGQKEIGTAVTEDSKIGEVTRDADCGYKLLINVCGNVNNNFMQTDLKKSCQKFFRNREYVKSNKEISKESEKKLKIAKDASSLEKEIALRDRVVTAFEEAYKMVKSLSGPAIDSRGIVKRNGISLCDYEEKQFYSAKMLPVIVFGYLMRAGNLNIESDEKQRMILALNDENGKDASIQNADLASFSITEKMKENEASEFKKVEETEIDRWIEIGKKLYEDLKSVPTEWDILKMIRKNETRIAACPFSQEEWNENHNLKESKDSQDSLSENQNNVSQNTESESALKMPDSIKVSDYFNKGMTLDDSLSKIKVKENRKKPDTYTNILTSGKKLGDFLLDDPVKSKSVQINKTSQTVSKSVSNADKTVTEAPLNNTDSCKDRSNCPHKDVQGNYILYVERFGEYNDSTISFFSIIEPGGKKVPGYDGYIVEPGGPDTVTPNKNKRIVEGLHSLQWHIKSETDYSPSYLTLKVFNNKKNSEGLYNTEIHKNRGILIHYGLHRGWSIGCLLPSTKEIVKKHNKRGKIYYTENSENFFWKIIDFVCKIENTTRKEASKKQNNLKKVKLKVANKITKKNRI